MAIGTQVVSTQALKLIIGHEATMGDGGLNTGATRYQLPILSPPSIVDLTAPLESAPQILGKYAQDSDHSAHNRTGQMFEISFSVLCSPTVLDFLCQFAFEDGDGTNQISGNYSPPAWQNGADTDYSASIYIGGGGYGNNSADQDDVYYNGCICKSLEITHAIDSEGGKPVANVTFVTGYAPQYTDDVTDGVTTYTSLTGDSATDFTDWHTDNTYIENSGAGYEIHPYSYSVSLARDIQRVGCVDYTNYEPNGYVMAGGWDTSMNVVYKRDENFANFLSRMHDGTGTILRIADSSVSPFDIYVYGKISEHSVDSGNPELRNSITIKGMRNIEGSDVIVNLEM